MPTDNIKPVSHCPLCAHPQCKKLEEAIRDHALTISDISLALKMSKLEVEVHLKEHTMREGEKTTITPVKATNIEVINSPTSQLKQTLNTHEVLVNNLLTLSDRLGMYTDTDDYSISNTKNLVMLAQEVRKTIMDLAVLEGKIQGQQHVTINQFNDLKAIIITDLCPICKGNVLHQLELRSTKGT